jgi:selenocysteine lyase/cysteine desulfurase
MTGVVNKFQRILGLKVPENLKDFINVLQIRNLLFFISHMEHHSNQTSWLETIADVAVPATEDGLFSTENLEILLENTKTEVLKLRQLLPALM